jgi:hypothetical protein
MLWFILSVIGSLFYWLMLVPGKMSGFQLPVGGLYVPLIYGLSLVTATIGYKIGVALRNFVMPDMMVVHGGFRELLEAKIWWMIGPPGAGYCGGAIVPYAAVIGLMEAGHLPSVL